MSHRIPYSPTAHIHSEVEAEILQTFAAVYRSQWYILGKYLQTFEQQFADYLGVRHVVGVGSGFDALYLSLKCLDIGPGDEVIVPAHTFAATGLAVHHAGAIPVFVDVDPTTANVQPEYINAALTSKTKAVIGVHLYGRPFDVVAISALCSAAGIVLIEDFAQAHGTAIGSIKAGTTGRINATSFYPVKNLGALGDAGAISTNDDALANKARMLRNYGGISHHKLQLAGVNTRLDELHAAILSVKLKYLDKWNSERIRNARQYVEMLHGVGDLILPEPAEGERHVYHIFSLRTQHRDGLRAALEQAGVQTLIHYEQPLHLMPAFQYLGHSRGDFPVSEHICNTTLSLPIHPGLTPDKLSYIGEVIRKYFRN
jgi:dTDP-4-amino-4,6-dideoxygalactose transaminase